MSPLRFALFGHPVGHSVSAAMFRAAFGAEGLPHVYDLVDAPDDAALEREIERLRGGELRGANVTMPHKRAALERADEVAPSASDTGAANVLERDPRGRVVAHNTDVEALYRRLPPCTSALVLGVGGAALAAVRALRRRGARSVIVTSRSLTAEAPRDSRAARLVAAGAELAPFGAPLSPVDVVVQATSAGVRGGSPQSRELLSLVPWSQLQDGAFAIDLVYGPAPTPFVAAAKARGLSAEDGLPMLVGQAELAFALWLGRPSPPGVMRRAALRALALG